MAQEEGALIFSKLVSRLPGLRAAGAPEHNLRSVLRGFLHLPVTAHVDRRSAISRGSIARSTLLERT
jgi:hypothetical protein